MWHESEVYHEGEYENQLGYRAPVAEYPAGDINQDMEYDRQFMQKNYILSEPIKNFLLTFQTSIREHRVYDIQDAYENRFPKLTDRLFSSSRWPEAEDVARNIPCDTIFLILYKELYYRHVYARCEVTFSERIESFQNYCQLFNYIIDATHPVELTLPQQWLWDIIDEFIYQYQSFSQHCSKNASKKEEELEVLRNSPTLWNVHQILNVLHSLVEKSNINVLLEDDKYNPGEFGSHDLYKYLGYFSLIGLLRLHSLHGDYYLALKVIEKINFNSEEPTFMLVPSCHSTAYYYVGFAYMMMKRYKDAIRTFTNALLFLRKTKHLFQSKTYLYDQVNKQSEQFYTLLVICLVLHPMSVDEVGNTHLREKFAERMMRMQKGELSEFESCFQFACPKFLFATPPNWDVLQPNSYREPQNQQLNVFMTEVVNQLLISDLRSYLKLYTTISISKLASLMNMEEAVVVSHLMSFKHKTQNLVWTKGSSCLDGEFQSTSEIDFYIDKDMIHIADTKVERRYGDFFIMNIHKLQQLNTQLRKSVVTSSGR